ncbi:hypothetical protein Ancab_032851 [Ancistrocladus abbreviatus]
MTTTIVSAPSPPKYLFSLHRDTCNLPLSTVLTPVFVKTKQQQRSILQCSLSSSTSIVEEEGSPPFTAPPSENAPLDSDGETGDLDALPPRTRKIVFARVGKSFVAEAHNELIRVVDFDFGNGLFAEEPIGRLENYLNSNLHVLTCLPGEIDIYYALHYTLKLHSVIAVWLFGLDTNTFHVLQFFYARVCEACGREEIERDCNGEGRIQGGIATVPGFGWWPIKAYRPCPGFVASGGRYKRRGQSMDEVAFGGGKGKTSTEAFDETPSRKKGKDRRKFKA